MRRISNEDGLTAGGRNIGRLALGIIPFALGLAASVWLGVWIEAHYFLINVSQERRRGELVGAPNTISSPIKVTAPLRLQGPDVRVDIAEYSGGELTVKFHAIHDANAFEIHWAWISPDGTHMGQSWDKVSHIGGPWSLAAGEKGIFTEKWIEAEPRASILEIWMESE